jgi:tetratricopeptide (TPR) repeat protein
VTEKSAQPAPAGNGKAATPEAATGMTASPWSDAQAAKLRKEAQDVLAQLLDIQFALEERSVERWAAEPFDAARSLAEAGDELYRQRDYVQARASYEASLAQLQAIQDSVPGIVNDLLQAALEGIEAGEPDAVTRALELARAIEPENAGLPALEARAMTLPGLLALLDQAAAAEAAGDLGAAEAALQKASELDNQHQHTASELARVSATHLDQRFNDAMSDGYMALDSGEYRRARDRFNAAAALQPGSVEAASALQELAAAEQGGALTRLKRDGERYAQAEQWQEALEAYEQALKIDANVAFATEGVAEARTRARLDSQFRAAINKPDRLYDIAVAEATGKLLDQARLIDPRGPVLSDQINRLEQLLRQANTPVPVTLRSDGETEVIVYKIARLGKFQQRELTLRPGTYTARGSRNGYRDVLEKFTITHEGVDAPITIACREPIN